MSAKKYKKGLVWFRHDLRIEDQLALFQATINCKYVYLIFIFDDNILSKLKKNDRRVSFIWDCLSALKKSLPNPKMLKIISGKPQVNIPKLSQILKVDAVYASEDYEPLCIERDNEVALRLKSCGIHFFLIKDSVIFHKDDILKKDGEPYKVFTAYKKQWFHKLSTPSQTRPDLRSLKLWPRNTETKDVNELSIVGFKYNPCDEPPGEKGANKRLKIFSPNLDSYHINRDFPSIDGTSYLSTHLRFGTISIRKLVIYALNNPSQGSDVWLSELIWREFYKMILYKYPWVTHRAFNPKYDNVIWQGNHNWLNSWKNGETGFPIVDAAMRNFNRTGRMHNRLRMVVAQFLTKDLLNCWLDGETYFAKGLLDFDLSANSGGWQWSASVGCDAQPYFRIFNPSLQSKRYDPDAIFIKKELPELKDIPNKLLHDPLILANVRPKTYPPPIINHKKMRLRAMEMFKVRV